MAQGQQHSKWVIKPTEMTTPPQWMDTVGALRDAIDHGPFVGMGAITVEVPDGDAWVQVDTPHVYDLRSRFLTMFPGYSYRCTCGTGAPGRSFVVFRYGTRRGDFDPMPEGARGIL